MINESGQVAGDFVCGVGCSKCSTSYHGFHTGPNGWGMFDPNDQVSFSDGTVISEALGISDTGYVLAAGTNSVGTKNVFVLKNLVSEPSTYVLMSLGLAAAGVIARRSRSQLAAAASSRA